MVDQLAHCDEMRFVADVASAGCGLHKARMTQRLEMKGQRGRRYRELYGDLASVCAGASALYQPSEDRKTRVLSQSRQLSDCKFRFHNSIIVEMSNQSSAPM